MVYSGSEVNFGKISLKNASEGSIISVNVRCGRVVTKKGEGKTSANITENGIQSGRGTKADGTKVAEIVALVEGMVVTLDPQTGIVTTDGESEDATWGDENFGVSVNMTVSGSGTSSVTIQYVITAYLTGGVADPDQLPNPVTFTFTYTGESVED